MVPFCPKIRWFQSPVFCWNESDAEYLSGEKFLPKNYIPWNFTQHGLLLERSYLVSTKKHDFHIFNIHLGKAFQDQTAIPKGKSLSSTKINIKSIPKNPGSPNVRGLGVDPNHLPKSKGIFSFHESNHSQFRFGDLDHEKGNLFKCFSRWWFQIFFIFTLPGEMIQFD